MGGDSRQESVRLALEHVRSDRVITHNAALPFVTQELIANVVWEDYPCVTTVTSMVYPVCRGDEFAEQMVRLEGLKLINTPQSFHTEVFRECHRKAYDELVFVNSDCELMLHYGHTVRFVEGDVKNFKITTPLDVILARAIAQENSIVHNTRHRIVDGHSNGAIFDRLPVSYAVRRPRDSNSNAGPEASDRVVQ